MGMLAEFQAFIKRGNVMDLAVGVIIGGAFGKIVSSVVARRAHARDRPRARAASTSPRSRWRSAARPKRRYC